MATSSIFRNITIDDDASCRSFLDAVESSMRAKKKELVMPKGVKVITDTEEIKKLAQQ
jgi:hypothetical protein